MREKDSHVFSVFGCKSIVVSVYIMVYNEVFSSEAGQLDQHLAA